MDLSTLPVDRLAQELHDAEHDATTVAPLTERHPGMGVREASRAEQLAIGGTASRRCAA